MVKGVKLVVVYMGTVLFLQTNQNISYLVAIVDCTRVGSATASFEDLVTLTGEHCSNLIEDQLQPPLDMVS